MTALRFINLRTRPNSPGATRVDVSPCSIAARCGACLAPLPTKTSGLFPDHMICRHHGAGRRGFRDRKRQPGGPAGRPIGGVELAISLQAHKRLVAADRKNIPNLGAYAETPPAEATKHHCLPDPR